MTFPIYGKIKKMFQTTNKYNFSYVDWGYKTTIHGTYKSYKMVINVYFQRHHWVTQKSPLFFWPGRSIVHIFWKSPWTQNYHQLSKWFVFFDNIRRSWKTTKILQKDQLFNVQGDHTTFLKAKRCIAITQILTAGHLWTVWNTSRKFPRPRNFLVGGFNHLEKYSSMGRMTSHILWKIKNVWNHQLVWDHDSKSFFMSFPRNIRIVCGVSHWISRMVGPSKEYPVFNSPWGYPRARFSLDFPKKKCREVSKIRYKIYTYQYIIII